MTQSSFDMRSPQLSGELPMRPSQLVMDLNRMGCYHQTRLSFMRTLIRRIMNEQWQIEPVIMKLDADGYGLVVYEVQAPQGLYSFVLFSHYLEPAQRNDRVISTQWDLTMALCEGHVDEQQLAQLHANVPKQEAGRVNSRVFVLSRANRSSRNFEYIVDCLAGGQQPDPQWIAQVGYLYRTTAVYGSGKLGMADWAKVKQKYPDFARPFAAEMFTCFMLRHFSLLQVEHISQHRSPSTYVSMDERIKRYFGIGNSTGLGMAPFLIHHPLLISQWIEMRETALARVIQFGAVTLSHIADLGSMVRKAIQHLAEVATDDERQISNNSALREEMNTLADWLNRNAPVLSDWSELQEYAKSHWRMETQEVINTLLMELYPELVDDLEDQMGVDETHDLQPDASIASFKTQIEAHYQWALDIDFSRDESQHLFWYRSEDKLEPRLGRRDVDQGKEKEMPLAIGAAVRQCYDTLLKHLDEYGDLAVTHFLLHHPELRGITRRIQTMSRRRYAEIQANLVDKNVLPIHLLRCKLAFFGVSKFDPRSILWVRNTMFQGAPLLSDIGKPFADDWFFPVTPELKDEKA